MTYTVKTIAYFTVWGLVYGVALGAFSGTAILPYFGTLYATIWGGGIGVVCGILSGVVASVVRARSFNHDTDLDQFRRRMALGLGAMTAIAAPLLLLATTNSILWGSGMMRDIAPWTILSLFSASFWGGLSAAYMGSHYPTFIARLMAQRDYHDEDVNLPQSRRDVADAMSTLMRSGLNRWIYVLGAVTGGLVYLLSRLAAMSYAWMVGIVEVVAYFAIGGLLGLIATLFMTLYVAFGNAALLTFLKRLIFREYFSHLPPHWTRRILTLTAFIFTGAVTYWATIFAPVIAFVMALAVYRTLALPDEPLDKAKRKEKNALALEDDIDEEDEGLLLDDERLIEEREQR